MNTLATDQTQPILSLSACDRTLIDVVVHHHGSVGISVFIDHEGYDENNRVSTEEILEGVRHKLSQAGYKAERKTRWTDGQAYDEKEWAAITGEHPEVERFTETWDRWVQSPNIYNSVTIFYPNTDKRGE